jgi:hypothetical protein
MTNCKKAVVSAVAGMCLLGAACDNPASSSSESSGNSAQFYVYDPTSPSGANVPASYYTITAYQMAVGQKCEVWVEAGANVSKSDAQEIAGEYDSVIYPAMKDAFGFPVDGINIMEAGDYLANNDGRLLLLLLDIRDYYSGGSGDAFMGGFFNPIDLLSFSKSNNADIIYVDINPGRIKSDGFYGTIAHELQHLIQFASDVALRNRPGQSGIRLQDIWINEGLSTAAEYVYLNRKYSAVVAHQKTGRVWDYNTLSDIRDGNTFFVWSNDLADYATGYLFFQWLRIHGSSQIYQDILRKEFSPDDSDLDYRVVLNAARRRFAGNAAAHTGDWETLLRSWFAANCVNARLGDANDIYGYKGEIATLPRAVVTNSNPGASTTRPLKPGEGVYSRLTIAQNPTGPVNIKYAGLNVSTRAVSTSGPYASGEWLLTFNGNPNILGGAENGTVYVSAVPPPSMQATPEADGREPRRTGVPDLLRGGVLSVPLIDARGRNPAGFLLQSGERE